MSFAPEFCSVAAETAEMAIGTLATVSARRVAVTMISPALSATSALAVVLAVGWVVDGGVLSCARAGVAMATTATDIISWKVRILSSLLRLSWAALTGRLEANVQNRHSCRSAASEKPDKLRH